MNKMMKHVTFLTLLVALFAALSMPAYADQSEQDVDQSLVFATQTQLDVYVDGQWTSDLSDSYGFGDTADITAPDVSGKSFSHREADGFVISYSNPLKLTMNAHTTLYAVYANAAPANKPAAGFTSITRTNDGAKISFQAIAYPGSGAAVEAAGIIYSTTATGNSLTIGGTNVTKVEDVKLTDSTTTMPQSVLDDNNCWMLQITPDSADTVYHARAYVTSAGSTTYGDVKDVKLSNLKSGISLIANSGSIDPEGSLDAALAELSKEFAGKNPTPSSGGGNASGSETTISLGEGENVNASVSGSTLSVGTINVTDFNKAAGTAGSVNVDASGLSKDIREIKLDASTVKNLKNSDVKDIELSLRFPRPVR